MSSLEGGSGARRVVGDSWADGGEHLAGSGRRWLLGLEAGTPLNLHRAAPTGQNHLAAQDGSLEGEFTAG